MIGHKLVDNKKLEHEIRNIIVDVSRCRANRIKLSTKITDDLGIDSFTALEILVAVEKKYKISIPEHDLGKLSTFFDLISLVSSRYFQAA
ncbi:MAG: acyl carrier protein [Bdellovibrionales bacterium]